MKAIRYLRSNRTRYLWLSMRREERFYERERACLSGFFANGSGNKLLSASGKLIATTILGANQYRRFLGL